MSGFLSAPSTKVLFGVYYSQFNNTILASKNVSSVSDLGTGVYRVNYDNALSTKNIFYSGMSNSAGAEIGSEGTSSVNVNTYDENGTLRDVRTSIIGIEP